MEKQVDGIKELKPTNKCCSFIHSTSIVYIISNLTCPSLNPYCAGTKSGQSPLTMQSDRALYC